MDGRAAESKSEADVIYKRRNGQVGELSTLPNIAEKLEAQLIDAGITTIKQLKEVGSREAWRRIFERDPSACSVRLYAFEGAIQGIPMHTIDEATKKSLKEFYKEHKR
jgi:DNA transformation protein